MRKLAAACEVFALAELTHRRPAFGIASVMVEGAEQAVEEEIVHATAFGSLLHFKKENAGNQPRVVLVAPMSGHFATLLRETVRTMLADHDVYITDWHNARDVPLAAGRFGLEEYIDHVIAFLAAIGPPGVWTPTTRLPNEGANGCRSRSRSAPTPPSRTRRARRCRASTSTCSPASCAASGSSSSTA